MRFPRARAQSRFLLPSQTIHIRLPFFLCVFSFLTSTRQMYVQCACVCVRQVGPIACTVGRRQEARGRKFVFVKGRKKEIIIYLNMDGIVKRRRKNERSSATKLWRGEGTPPQASWFRISHCGRYESILRSDICIAGRSEKKKNYWKFCLRRFNANDNTEIGATISHNLHSSFTGWNDTFRFSLVF